MTRLRAVAWGLAAAGIVSAALVSAVGVLAGTAPARAPGLPASSPSSCLAGHGMPAGFGSQRHAGMVRIPAGSVQLGSSAGYADERPNGDTIRIPSFWMDRTEVTNAQFAAFVKATGYVTQAEREGAAAVFRAPRRGAVTRENAWWVWQRGADWRFPQGRASAVRAQPDEPVVHVTYADALAYARWLGRDLPTEAEWEYAARGGGSPELVDREPRDPRGRTVANYWQGVFPDMNSGEDGYIALAPVGCFPANGYGLFDMIGNVWELTRDRYTGGHQSHGNGDPGAARRAAEDAPAGTLMVIKGGSFLCAADYCVRYRAAAR